MNYDLTFLLEKEEEQKIAKEIIASFSGKINKESAWGKKILVYPIKKLRNAFFLNWQIDMEKKNISEFKKKLNFDEKIIRYLLLKV